MYAATHTHITRKNVICALYFNSDWWWRMVYYCGLVLIFQYEKKTRHWGIRCTGTQRLPLLTWVRRLEFHTFVNRANKYEQPRRVRKKILSRCNQSKTNRSKYTYKSCIRVHNLKSSKLVASRSVLFPMYMCYTLVYDYYTLLHNTNYCNTIVKRIGRVCITCFIL